MLLSLSISIINVESSPILSNARLLLNAEDNEGVFKNSVTCVPNVGKFRLVNNDPNDELEVLSVESTDPKHFHPTIVQPTSLRPTDHIPVTVVFLPLKPGTLKTQLKVVTSTGELYFDLEGYANVNDWGLTDISANELSVDQVISLPIKIHNPTDSPFHLEDVFAVESSNADWAEVQLKEDDISDIYIGPGVTETVGNLKVSISEPGEHSGYLHIKTKDVMGDSVPNFVVPLSFSVLRPGLYLPPMIDFGILTSPDTVATLPVPMKNVGQEDLVITGYYSTASALSISPAEDEIIPPQGESTIWLSYSGKEEGVMEGVIRVMSNSSDPRWMEVEVAVKGKIMWGGVGWKESDTWIKVETEEMWEAKKAVGGQSEAIAHNANVPLLDSVASPKKHPSSKRLIKFANFFKENVKMNNVSTDCGQVITVNELAENDEVVGYGESWEPIAYTYQKIVDRGEGGNIKVEKGDPLFFCKMRIQTNVSYHDIPMYLYDGKVRVQTDEMLLLQGGVETHDEGGTTDDSNCSSYMDLRDCDASTSTESTIDEYLNLIYSDLSNNVKPVVVKFGAVGANEIRTKNLYLTNYNPVPVNVTISAGEVSGMSVNLGRIESPIDTIVDLDDKGKYLLLSDDNSDYASKIYTYDVRFSSRVPQELMEQYEKFPDSSVFGSEAGRKVDEGDLQDLKGYKVDPGAGVAGSQHVKAPKWKNTGGNGVLVSLDGMFEHKLKGEKKKGGEEVVTLPPGGIARLEVNIATPPSSVLLADLTSFLATGLEVKTADEVIPIAVSYDTIMGNFKLMPFDFNKFYDVSVRNDDSIFNVDFLPTQVHADLMREYEDAMEYETDGSGMVAHHPDADKFFVSKNKKNSDIFHFYNHGAKLSKGNLPRSGENVDVLTIPPILKQVKDNDEDYLDPYIDLVLKRALGRNLEISSIDSCNPWFNVTLITELQKKLALPALTNDWWNTHPRYAKGNASDSALVSEDETSKAKDKEEEELFPVGRLHHTLSCGGTSDRYKKPFIFNQMSFWNCAQELIAKKSAMHKDGCGGIMPKAVGEKEIKAEKKAAAAIDKLIKHQTKEDFSNVVSKKQLELWEDASDAWATYTDLGLNTMGTSLVANQEDGEDGSKLVMSPLVVKSNLDPPQLLFGKHKEVVFETVEVGEVAAGFVYLGNPTGARVVATLTNEVNDNVSYVQRAKSDSNSWFSSMGWAMRSEDPRNSILQVGYGNSIHTQAKKKWNHAVHGISHLLRGCTRRCGIKQEVTTPVSLFAPISPTVPEDADGSLQAYKVTKPNVFAISYDASIRRVVKPYQIERFGPIFFRPWGPGEFTTDIYIKNDVTLFEKVKLVGKGVVENMEFEGVGEDAGDMRDVEGMSAMMFPMGMDKRPREVGSNETVKELPTRTIKVKNEGETVMNIGRWYLSSTWDKVGTDAWDSRFQRMFWREEVGCSSRGFKIIGCKEGSKQEEVVLRPGESFEIAFEHTPDCVFSTLFAYLVVDINKVRTSMVEWEDIDGKKHLKREPWVKSVPMMVGYSASDYEAKECELKDNIYRGGSTLHKLAFVAACLALLYWVALEVLNRHDFMLRFEETYSEPFHVTGYPAIKAAIHWLVKEDPSVDEMVARFGKVDDNDPEETGFGTNLFRTKVKHVRFMEKKADVREGKQVKGLLARRNGKGYREGTFEKWLEERKAMEKKRVISEAASSDGEDEEEAAARLVEEEEERAKNRINKEERRKLAEEQQRQALKAKAKRQREASEERRKKEKEKKEKEEALRRATLEEKKEAEARETEERRKEVLERARRVEEDKKRAREREGARKREEAERATAEFNKERERQRREEEERVSRKKEEKKKSKEEKEKKRMAESQEEKNKRLEEKQKAAEESRKMQEESKNGKEKQEDEVRRVVQEHSEMVEKVSDVILTQKGVAEVSWLIQTSKVKGSKIEGVFKQPSDVARFCILNPEFELRREHQMDFMVMKSIVRGKDTGGGGVRGGMGGRGGHQGIRGMASGQAPPPITTRGIGEELPMPPPGMVGTGSPMTGSMPIPSSLTAPAPSTLGALGGSPLNLSSLISPIGYGRAGSGTLEEILGSGDRSVGVGAPGQVARLTIQPSEMGGALDLGSSLTSDGFDLNDLLPTDIADLVMDGEDDDGVDGEELWGGGGGGLLIPSSLLGELGGGGLGDMGRNGGGRRGG